ncbi:MAG: NnrU family protein [Pseudomonadota bacterium]|nr:NnrU family protein [Pseudomonadota bacterium]
MILFVMGLAAFLGLHSIAIVAPQWRARQVARLGEGRWKGTYSLLAALGLALLIVGYGLARRDPVVLYQPPSALRHGALLLMLPVFPLLFAAYLPGRIQATVKHPMLLAVKLWATAHLLANGTLLDVFLFGSFLLWAVADRISVKRRSLGQGDGRQCLHAARNDTIAVVAGLAVYGAVVAFGHRWLIGVPPLG